MKNFEKWLYQENSVSQQFFMLFILGNTAFTIFYTNNIEVDYDLGLFIMLNIILSLTSFLVAVRQKLYAMNWGLIGIAISIFQFIRLLWIPEEIVGPLRYQLQILLVATSIFALIGSLICLKRTRERQKYIIENNIDLALLQK